jgi:hypothetical protein
MFNAEATAKYAIPIQSLEQPRKGDRTRKRTSRAQHILSSRQRARALPSQVGGCRPAWFSVKSTPNVVSENHSTKPTVSRRRPG